MALGPRGFRPPFHRHRPRSRALLVPALLFASLLAPWAASSALADESDEEIIEAPDVVFEELLGSLENTAPEPDAQGVTAHMFDAGPDERSFLLALRDSEPCSLPEGASEALEGRGLRLTAARTDTFVGIDEEKGPWTSAEFPEPEVHYASPHDLIVEIVEPEYVFSTALRFRVECLAENGEWEEAARVEINSVPLSQSEIGAFLPVHRFSPVVREDGTIPLEINRGIDYVNYDLPALGELEAQLNGQPVTIEVADENSGQVVIPEDTEPGLHMLTFERTTVTPEGAGYFDLIDLPVVYGFAAPPAQPSPTPEPVVADGLPRIDQLRLDPVTLMVAAVASLGLAGLISLIGFPSDLFNKSVEADNSRPRTRWWARLRGMLSGRRAWGRSTRFSPLSGTAFVLVWVLAAALPVFVNWRPGAPDATPFLDFLGMLVAVFAVTMLYSGVVNVRDWRWSHVPGRFEVLLPGVVIVLVCAVVSFVSRFEPGYFYGLVAGFVAVADRRSKLDLPEAGKDDFVRVQEGRATLAGAAALWALCVLCYVTWSGVNSAVEQGVGGTVLAVLDKALFATTVLGLQTAVFGLAPVRFMDGHRLWRWNKRIWVLAYAPGAFLFVYLLHLHADRVLGTSVPESLRLSLILFCGFGTLSVAVWLFAYVREQRRTPPDPPAPVLVTAPVPPPPPPTPSFERVPEPQAPTPAAVTLPASDSEAEPRPEPEPAGPEADQRPEAPVVTEAQDPEETAPEPAESDPPAPVEEEDSGETAPAP